MFRNLEPTWFGHLFDYEAKHQWPSNCGKDPVLKKTEKGPMLSVIVAFLLLERSKIIFSI
jgi:hypothetical protein